MSTRSRIGILNPDGSTRTIYCHSDGYPEYQLPILTKNYSTLKKVEALLKLGDISILGERTAPNPEEEHSFKDRVKGVTVAYHRDRGETMTAAFCHRSIDALKASDWSIDWFYLFDAKKGRWLPPICGRALQREQHHADKADFICRLCGKKTEELIWITRHQGVCSDCYSEMTPEEIEGIIDTENNG